MKSFTFLALCFAFIATISVSGANAASMISAPAQWGDGSRGIVIWEEIDGNGAKVYYWRNKNEDGRRKLTPANFDQEAKVMFGDNPFLVEKIGTKGYQFQDLGKILDEYNRWRAAVNRRNAPVSLPQM